MAWLWKEQADSRNVCLKQKEVLLMLYYIDKNLYHFIKDYLEWFSKFAFQKSCSPSRATKQTYFGNLAHPQIHFGCPKPSSECLVTSLCQYFIFSHFFRNWLKWSTALYLIPKITENIVYRDIDLKYIETTLFWKLFL